MEINEKIEILTDAAKYDVSCSSSGSNRKNKNRGIGDGAMSGICHSWSEDGRCISLLKILFTNKCIYNCEYCVNRRDNQVKRAEFTPREIADLTINFYRRNYIEGLFLSSGIIKSPDYTMELLIKTAEILRYEYKYNGYIHMKAIPASSKDLVTRLGLLVDRMSVNIELPTQKSLALLAPEKSFENIFKPMNQIKNALLMNNEENKIFKNSPKFLPAGQTTQMIVGAGGETDLELIERSEGLYDKYSLKRVYYSAFVPVVKSKFTEGIDKTPLLREHRIYQADWLLRFYGFRSKDLLNENNKNLDLRIDPKSNWAINNIEKFPIEINRASFESLIKVPGFGIVSAKKIINARKFRRLTFEDLKAMKISIKRAKNFITVGGFYRGNKFSSKENLKEMMSLNDTSNFEQLSLWSLIWKWYMMEVSKAYCL